MNVKTDKSSLDFWFKFISRMTFDWLSSHPKSQNKVNLIHIIILLKYHCLSHSAFSIPHPGNKNIFYAYDPAHECPVFSICDLWISHYVFHQIAILPWLTASSAPRGNDPHCAMTYSSTSCTSVSCIPAQAQSCIVCLLWIIDLTVADS